MRFELRCGKVCLSHIIHLLILLAKTKKNWRKGVVIFKQYLNCNLFYAWIVRVHHALEIFYPLNLILPLLLCSMYIFSLSIKCMYMYMYSVRLQRSIHQIFCFFFFVLFLVKRAKLNKQTAFLYRNCCSRQTWAVRTQDCYLVVQMRIHLYIFIIIIH